jgi:hypothetical protein
MIKNPHTGHEVDITLFDGLQSVPKEYVKIHDPQTYEKEESLSDNYDPEDYE